MLSGQSAMPRSISGFTTDPSRMPTSTKDTRATGGGTSMGRPLTPATATASIEPDTRPAGNPTSVNATPPIRATVSVSARRARDRREGDNGTTCRDHDAT